MQRPTVCGFDNARDCRRRVIFNQKRKHITQKQKDTCRINNRITTKQKERVKYPEPLTPNYNRASTGTSGHTISAALEYRSLENLRRNSSKPISKGEDNASRSS